MRNFYLKQLQKDLKKLYPNKRKIRRKFGFGFGFGFEEIKVLSKEEWFNGLSETDKKKYQHSKLGGKLGKAIKIGSWAGGFVTRAAAGAVIGLVVPGIEVENIATTRKTLPDFPGLWSSLLD